MSRIIVFMVFSVFVLCYSPQVFSEEIPVKKFFPAEATPQLYSSGVLVGKTYYVSGAGSALPGGGQPETFPDQVRQCLKSIQQVLQFAGLDMQHAVQAWVMLDDPNNFEALNAVFREIFPENPPARTTLGIANIPSKNPIEITMIAYTDLSERKIIGSSKAPQGLPFSPAVLAGNTLYISGQGDMLPDDTHPLTFEEQARQALKNVGVLLKEAGLDYRHVVFSNVYLDTYENLGTFNKVYREFFRKGSEPARATVLVNTLPGGSHVEVTCIATTELKEKKIIRSKGLTLHPKELTECASPAVFAGNTLYLSAQYGVTPEESANLEQQIRGVMTNHLAILREAGLDYTSIVSGNVFLRSISDYGPLNKIYPEFFAAGRPGVRTCFQPFSGVEKNDVLVRMYFFAAQTRTE